MRTLLKIAMLRQLAGYTLHSSAAAIKANSVSYTHIYTHNTHTHACARRPENAWADGLMRLYAQVRTLRTTSTFKPSMADIVVLGAHLALVTCSGPRITFVPGRIDATVANAPARLPAESESAKSLAAYASRIGFNNEEFTVLMGMGHTICNMVSQCTLPGCLGGLQ